MKSDGVNKRLNAAAQTLEKIIRLEVTQKIIDKHVANFRDEFTPIVTEAVKSVSLDRFERIRRDYKYAEELDIKISVNDIVLTEEDKS